MDNTTIRVQTGGDVIATDDIGGVKYQRMKLTVGDDGVNDGDVSKTNPLPTEGVSKYILKMDQATDVILYVGEAVPGSLDTDAVWRIKKIDETTGLSVLWANGNTNFDNRWDQRATVINYS